MAPVCEAGRSSIIVGPDDEVLLALVELARAGVDVLLELALARLEVAAGAAVAVVAAAAAAGVSTSSNFSSLTTCCWTPPWRPKPPAGLATDLTSSEQ
jgi:hypothetical protein